MLYIAPTKAPNPPTDMNTKEKYQLEVGINASPQLLYQYISTPAGLASWYADDVCADADVYLFFWNKSPEKAILMRTKLDEYIRFHWVDDDPSNTFFEIRINVDELTQEVSLVIVDFAYPDEIEEAKQMWRLQIADLKARIGG